MNNKVKKYIEKQEDFKKELLYKSRELLIKSIPDCLEEFKWGVPVYDDGKFYLAAMKTRVHIGFTITGLSKEEVSEFDGTGKTMRHIKIHSMDELDEEKLRSLIKLVHEKTIPPSDYK